MREAIPSTAHQGIRVAAFDKPCLDFHWHFHPEVELMLLESGHGVIQIGGSMRPFGPGDFCLIGANIPHACRSHPDEPENARWTVLHFLPDTWGPDFWRLPEMRRIAGLLSRARPGLLFEKAKTGPAGRIVAELKEASMGGLRLARWMEVMESLSAARGARFLDAVSVSGRGDGDARLGEVLGWIDRHIFSADMTQAEAARHLRLSPQAFCRFFRQATGRTFHRYVNELRVALSCSELSRSEKTVAEIAFGSGFGTLANFNRRFREITGATPTEYRRSRLGKR